MSNAALGTASAEAQVLAHPVVQRELSCQNVDIELLRQGDLAAVQSRALTSPLLTSEELQTLIT